MTEKAQERKMPWWGIVGGGLIGVAAVSLIVNGEADTVTVALFALGALLLAAGLIVRGR
jgi:hypothetical protein